jgi:S1-C subfamily serine protease
MLRSALAVGCLAGALIILGSANRVKGQNSPVELPTIASLRALSYEKSSLSDLSATTSYHDLMTIIRLGGNYSQGMHFLPQYREPLLTRGSTGITVFKNVAPSVVLIVVGDVKNKEFEPTGLGAGVIINSTGDILTNWHVIDGYSEAMILLKPAGSADIKESDGYVAEVVAQDKLSDLALLRIVKPPTTLIPVLFGTISSVQVGEDVHVIGHPKGNFWSYGSGVVSQIRPAYQWSYSDGSKHEAKVLQLQTAINPGNSGGPVLDDQGKLLALIAMSEEGQNLNYAIAVDAIQGFRTSTAATRTRGGTPQSASVVPDVSVGFLKNGSRVVRCEYPSLVEYLVFGERDKSTVLLAEMSNGTNVTAWNPNSFSSFREWSITFPNGTSVRARGNTAIPEVFSLH